jgi:hypothetical protein
MKKILSVIIILVLAPIMSGMLLWIQPSRFTPAGPSTPPFSDDFTRANESPIAGNWEVLAGTADLTSNEVVSGSFGIVRVKTTACTFNSNHKSEIDTSASTVAEGAATQPCVRIQSDGSCYRLQLSAGASAFYIQKVIWNGTGFDVTNLANQDGVPYSGGQLGLRISGTSIVGYIVGIGDQVSVTDATLSGGQPGFIIEPGEAVEGFFGDNI